MCVCVCEFSGCLFFLFSFLFFFKKKKPFFLCNVAINSAPSGCFNCWSAKCTTVVRWFQRSQPFPARILFSELLFSTLYVNGNVRVASPHFNWNCRKKIVTANGWIISLEATKVGVGARSSGGQVVQFITTWTNVGRVLQVSIEFAVGGSNHSDSPSSWPEKKKFQYLLDY